MSMPPDIARNCWAAIKERSVYEMVEINGQCAIKIGAWTLVPFVDGGGWDYVDAVIAPDGVRYEVDAGTDPFGDEDAIFNWYPLADVTPPKRCCSGYTQCWACPKARG